METNNKNFLENLGQSLRRSVTLKLLSIFIMMLLLMIPMSYVQSLIRERETLRRETVSEVSDLWAGRQTVYGPILTIPLQKKVMEGDKVSVIHSQALILPSSLEVTGQVEPRSLRRGIYEVVVYDSRLSFSGHFDNISEYLSEMKDYEAFPGEAFLTINISDMRGIRQNIVVEWDGQPNKVEPGSGIPGLVGSGISVRNFLSEDGQPRHGFSFDLQLQGSGFLGFIPLGRQTDIELTSGWKAPSFSGSFLPEQRSISEDGFTARWQVLELNRNYPQFWIGDRNSLEVQRSAFGVDLLLPANDYQKSMRSAKYAMLAISLTFLTFFLVEIFSHSRVHPLQYILVGLALVLFYTLLVSISEHTNFNLAYLISSLVIISITGLYSRAILGRWKPALALAGMLCLTYAFVFVTLQMQDFALLIGSIGLTAILSLTMYITRNINWYKLK